MSFLWLRHFRYVFVAYVRLILYIYICTYLHLYLYIYVYICIINIYIYIYILYTLYISQVTGQVVWQVEPLQPPIAAVHPKLAVAISRKE